VGSGGDFITGSENPSEGSAEPEMILFFRLRFKAEDARKKELLPAIANINIEGF
jgi:hypothetical protein